MKEQLKTFAFVFIFMFILYYFNDKVRDMRSIVLALIVSAGVGLFMALIQKFAMKVVVKSVSKIMKPKT